MLGSTAVANHPLVFDDASASKAFVDSFSGDGLRQHSWLVGLTAPVADAGTLMFSYAGNTAKNSELDGIDSLKVKSHNFGLGYRHNLSKRTSVYGVASYGWSEAKERGSVDVPTGTGKTKVTATQAIIGLQHRF
jgi:predicted porin